MDPQHALGQSIIVGFHGPRVTPALTRMIERGQIGGVILFATNGNIESPGQVRALTDGLQAAARSAGRPPLLIAIDQEGGRVARLTEATGFSEAPSAMALGACEQPAHARRVAQILAREMRAVGINVNLAPVLDVNCNPRNPVIGTRSFGSDPDRVSAFGTAAIAGMQSEGVLAVGKHFPGHGDTDLDSHVALPRVPHARMRLDAIELVPFRAAIAADVAGVMSAHATFPAIDPDGVPATLSAAALSRLLREVLGFDGLIATDSLEMGALSTSLGLSPAEAAERAYQAGADLLLFNAGQADQLAAHERLLAAYAQGAITDARITASLGGIERARRRLAGKPHGHDRDPVNHLSQLLPDHRLVLDAIAARAITCLGPTPAPIRVDHTLMVETPPAEGFGDELGTRVIGVQLDPEPGTILDVRAAAAQAEQVIVATCNVGLHPQQAALIDGLLADGRPITVLAVQDPYDAAYLPRRLRVICTYGFNPPMRRACRRLLLGQADAPGRLPVTLPEVS